MSPFTRAILRLTGKLLSITLVATLLTVTALSVLPFFSTQYLVELLNHFRLEYFIIQIVCFIGLLLLWLPRLALLAFISLLPNLMAVLPYYIPQSRDLPVGAPKIKIMLSNVLGVNRNTEAAARAIRSVNPDMLVLAEYNERWQHELGRSGVLKPYPHRYVVPYGNDGLYSKVPMENVKVTYLQPGKDPITVARFRMGDQPVTLLMVHPRPPVKPEGAVRNKNLYARWMRDYRQYGDNVILVGDLNSSPWSPQFQELIGKTGWRDSQLGFGLQPSWPVCVAEAPRLKLPFPVIPIDHVLVSRNFVVLNRRTGPSVGSDHLPVIVELGLKSYE